MWKTVFVLAVAVAAGVIEMRPMFRRSLKEAAVYGVLLAVGTVLSVAAINLAEWPSPLNVLETVFKPVHEWAEQLFE